MVDASIIMLIIKTVERFEERCAGNGSLQKTDSIVREVE